MSKVIEYNMGSSICSDTCWKNSKEENNKEISDYNLFDRYADFKSDNTYGSFPNLALEHPDLRGRPGYGVADSYLIDNYSALRNDPEALTHDKCQNQIFERVFQAPPLIKGAEGNIEEELSLLSGNDTNQFKCKKTIMEKELNYAYPLVDCLKDLQNPDHIVPEWTNGGEDTRSYKNRAEFNKRCQY